MLPKEKRLRDTRDFKRVYQKGSFFGSQIFTMSALPNKRAISRVGVVISKKVEPKAVKRNLLKRRFREAIGALYEKLPAGYDVVVSIKSKAKEADFTDVKAQVAEVFGKVGTNASSRHRSN
jgi:ribonuclease P protein component